MNIENFTEKLTPVQMLVAGYALVVVVGAFTLMLPISSADGTTQPFVDAVFISSSAVSTTGLTVVDVGKYYSFFGELVTLVLFQIGGIGYMVFIVLTAYAMGGRPSLISAITFKESLSGVTLANTKKFMKEILLFTFLIEGAGAAVLAVCWLPRFSVPEAIYQGIYHSVSGFCTCGFSLFSDNLMQYGENLVVNVTVPAICIAGGVGFIVLTDLRDYLMKRARNIQPHQLMVHTKLVLAVSVVVMLIGVGLIFFSGDGIPLRTRILVSVFQSVSASTTTGFNTVDIGAVSDTSAFTMALLMFIGAAPGGTAGGIKVTSLGVMLLVAWSVIQGREDVNASGRRISSDTIRKSFFIGLAYTLWVLVAVMLLTITERTGFLKIFFEVCSAIGDAGLSMGITPNLSVWGKCIISFTMFFGRVGPLALTLSLLGKPRPQLMRYAEGEVFVG